MVLWFHVNKLQTIRSLKINNMQSTRALTAFFLAFVSVNALTTTWQNSAGGNWSDPSNWDAGVPKTNDSAVIDMLTGSPIHCNVSINLYSLSLNFARLYLFNSSTIETGMLIRMFNLMSIVQQTGGSLYFENNSQVNNLYLSGNLYISPTTTVTISKLFQVTSPSVVSSSYTTGVSSSNKNDSHVRDFCTWDLRVSLTLLQLVFKYCKFKFETMAISLSILPLFP